MYKTILIMIITVLITSCDVTKVIYVAPNLVDCDGVDSKKCMQVKEQIDQDWVLLNESIEGFDYKEGFTHKIEVNISKIKNPPANASNIKYELIKIIYQEPSKTEALQEVSFSGNWQIDKIVGLDSLATKPTIVLDTETKAISGNAGCNNYGSTYTIDGETISIGLITSTKRMCQHMKVEKAFFDCLSKVATYKIVDKQLILFDEANDELLSCKAKN